MESRNESSFSAIFIPHLTRKINCGKYLPLKFRVISRFSRAIFFILLLLAGCVRFKPAMKGEQEEQPRGVEIHTQYAVSSDPKLGYCTFEVYIANHTKDTIVFTGAELNSKPLPKVQSKEISKLLTVTLGEGDEIQLTEPGFPDDSPVTWWQYYPCNTVKPGETIEFQVNFKTMPTSRQSLRLSYGRARASGLSSTALATEGPAVQGYEHIDVVAPRFRQPEKRLTAITYSLDGKRMFMQYASRKIGISRLKISGKTISGMKTLKSLGGDTPDLAAFDAPFRLNNGDVLHVQAEFADGSRRDAVVRVLLGIALDGAFGANSPREQAIRKEYGLDDFSVVEMLPFDVACGDTKAGKHGLSAPALTAERLKSYESQVQNSAIQNRQSKIENPLLAVNYCAAFYPGLCNIYGQISDAVYAKPYQLGWGKQPAVFIEAEERRALEEAQSAQPRPWLWVPDRYNRSGRYMAAGEQEVLAWLMLEHGGKGIRYHYWNKPVEVIKAEHPWLLSGLAKLNKEIASQKEMLSPLVPVCERALEKEKVKIYESWSGDQGILFMVRNLDYRTEAATEPKGREPKFNVVSKQNVNIAIKLPEWFKGKKAVDLLSRKSLPSEKQKDVMQIKLDRLDAFRLIWLE